MIKSLLFMALTGVAVYSLFPRSPAYPLTGFYNVDKCARSQETLEELARESEEIRKRGEETAKLYTLKPGETLKDITQELLVHPNTSEGVKQAITELNHKYYIFSYPSDGLIIKGYISVPSGKKTLPLIVLVRGGNRLFGIPHPGQLSAQPGYAVVTTTYRGGVSEGEDEFGGKDVNDVKNLVDFLPSLAQKLAVEFKPETTYMVGVSRGGMQMFLALERFPELQQKINKAVSISGLLNLVFAVDDRPDFKEMLKENFGYPEDEQQAKTWLAHRQPILEVRKIAKHLPILIAQGTADTRVCLKEGYDMLEALHAHGHQVTYIEIEGGDHVLQNTDDFLPVMMEWLEK